MPSASPDGRAAFQALHAAAQAHYAPTPGVHAPGLLDRHLLPDAIGGAWDSLVQATDVDHALLCPAFSFAINMDGAFLLDGDGTTLPPASLLPDQEDAEMRALCARGLEALAPAEMIQIDPRGASAHRRVLLARLAPPPQAVCAHLIRRGRTCVLLRLAGVKSLRFRLTAAARA